MFLQVFNGEQKQNWQCTFFSSNVVMNGSSTCSWWIWWSVADGDVYISCHPKKVIILSTAQAPVRSKKSKQCNCSSPFMVKAASSPNHSFAMTFHPFTILRLLERKEKIFHELEKKIGREMTCQNWPAVVVSKNALLANFHWNFIACSIEEPPFSGH